MLKKMRIFCDIALRWASRYLRFKNSAGYITSNAFERKTQLICIVSMPFTTKPLKQEETSRKST